EIIAETFDSTSYAIVVYRRNSDDSWSFEHDTTEMGTVNWEVGTPTVGPARRVILNDTKGMAREVEISATGAVTTIASYTAQSFQVPSLGIGMLNLTADGLRVVFSASSFTAVNWFSDRPSLSAPFRPAEMLANVPASFWQDMFMS